MAYYNSLERLQDILNELREKCPWDKKQTIHSLQPQTIEEIYELSDAIKNNNWQEIKEELGDLLLHLLFYTKIAEEQKQFTIEDVIAGISDKLIHRHPHIYGNVNVDNEEDVKRNWEKLKLKEGKKSILSGVPNAMPPFNKAITIQRKARNAGFDWDDSLQVLAKVKEEIAELEAAIVLKDQANIEEEMGDVLFSMINLSRFLQVDPENSLEECNQKFIYRFQYIEQAATKAGRDLHDMSLEDMDALWNEAKQNKKSEI